MSCRVVAYELDSCSLRCIDGVVWTPATLNLKGKEKKEIEAKKIEALGGKRTTNRKIPYKVLIGMRTKGVARKQRREDLVCRGMLFIVCFVKLPILTQTCFVCDVQMKESDVVTGKRKSSSKPRDKLKRKKTDDGLQATKGRFKRGVLDVRSL